MSTEFTGWEHEQQPSSQPDDLAPDGGQPDPADDARTPPVAPTTGDSAIDVVLSDLAEAQTGSLAERIEAGERAQAALQSRLRDLGGA